MKGTLHIENVEVLLKAIDGMILLNLSSGEVWVEKQDFTETPETIPCGTPVWAWNSDENLARIGLYSQLLKGKHWVSGGKSTVCIDYNHARPLTPDDLGGER